MIYFAINIRGLSRLSSLFSPGSLKGLLHPICYLFEKLKHFSHQLTFKSSGPILLLKITFNVTLHGTIRNKDFLRSTELQRWHGVVTIQNNVVTMLQRCVVLKIVIANRLV